MGPPDIDKIIIEENEKAMGKEEDKRVETDINSLFGKFVSTLDTAGTPLTKMIMYTAYHAHNIVAYGGSCDIETGKNCQWKLMFVWALLFVTFQCIRILTNVTDFFNYETPAEEDAQAVLRSVRV